VRAVLTIVVVIAVMVVWPSLDGSEGAAIWIGEGGLSVQGALDLAGKDGSPKLVRVPKGTFYSPTLHIPPGVHMRGSGDMNSTIIKEYPI
jgi:hypothetical protein